MKYKAILTHNPQDFFDGSEPHELCEKVEFDGSDDCPKIQAILQLVSNGYKAIIFRGGDEHG